MVPCIGEVTLSPLAAAPDFFFSRLGFFCAPAPAAAPAANPAGSTTSSRRPPTSTVTAWRSPASRASLSPEYGGIWLSNSVSIQLV